MVKAAQKSNHHSQLHAAFVFKGGAVVLVANNTPKEHAEIKALRFAERGSNLLSVRVNKKGQLVNAKPCAKCWEYMIEKGVHTVYYSTAAGTIVRERVPRKCISN